MNGFHSRIRTPRRAITLLELLIVMVILLMVTAAAIPIVAPATRNRQNREATRLASAYFGAARARAVQTGRPAGVLIERFNGNPFALQMSQVEVPQPYGGDFADSRLFVGRYTLSGTVTSAANNGAGLIRVTITPALPFNLDSTLFVTISNSGTDADGTWRIIPVSSTQFDLADSTFTGTFTGDFTIQCWPCVTGIPNDAWQGMIRYGDRVRLNYRGRHYTLSSLPPSMTQEGDPRAGEVVTVTPPGDDSLAQYWFLIDVSNSSPDFPPGYVGLGTPYQVFRQPVRTSTPPLILPDGIVVDLSVSGVGGMLFNRQPYADGMGNPLPIGTPAPAPFVTVDPMIIFSPSGRLEWVSSNNGPLVRPTDSVYLLIGRRELMFDATSRMQAQDIVFQNLSPVQTMPGVQLPPAENFWLTIGYQSGQVSVSEVAPNNQDHQGGTYSNLLELRNSAVTQSRFFARQAQSVGGR